MNTNINISWINQSNTDVYVQPQDGREYDDNFNISELNLTWVVDSFKNDTMILNLSFSNPFEISPGILQDQLIIIFKQSH